MKELLGRHFLAVDERRAAAMEEVAMGAAEGVVDLGQNGDQLTVVIVAVPETDRVEDKTQYARKGLQDDLAIVG